MVHVVKPPFLTKNINFSQSQDMISCVKDSTSDFAKLAKLGSDSVKEYIAEVIMLINIERKRERSILGIIRNKDGKCNGNKENKHRKRRRS